MNKRKILYLYFPLMFLLSACSVKKDSTVNRLYHKTTGWYNTLFNGEEALKEEVKSIEKQHQDDYSQVLEVMPGQFVPILQDENYEYDYKTIEHKKSNFLNKAAGKLDGFLDQAMGGSGNSNLNTGGNQTVAGVRSEQKAIKAIEEHSMLIKGTERNPMMAEAYLLLGKSRYYQGKAYEAMDAFNYIDNIKIKKKKKHALYNNEARFWNAKANFQAQNNEYALQELVELYQNKDIKKNLKRETATLYSQILINDKKYAEAFEALEKAKKLTKNKHQKGRITFVQAQLQNQLGNYVESSRLFDKVQKFHPGFDMEFWARMGIANNFVANGNDYEAFQRELNKLITNENYKEYKSQILFNQGLIAEKSNKLKEAEDFYKKGLLEKAGTDSITKAKTYLHLGNLYYNQEDYLNAANYYDSATTQLKTSPIILKTKERYQPLKVLVDNYKIMKNNDSILSVVALPADAQREFYQKKIDKIKEEDLKAEKLKEKESHGLNTRRKSTDDDKFGFQSNAITSTDKGKFYFYNQNLREQGIQEFKKIWGDRALTDNWRSQNRANNTVTTTSQGTTTSVDNAQKYDPEYYIKQLPTDTQVLSEMKQERDSAEFNIGAVYLDPLKNKKKSIETFEHLLTQAPNDELKAKTYFNLMLASEPNSESYNRYKNLIISQYPNTYYATYAMNPEAENFTVKNSNEGLSLYEKTFEAYEKGDAVAYQQFLNEAASKYGKEEIMAKFALLNAFYEGKIKGKEAMLSSLENIVLVYNKFPEAKKAQELIDLIKREFSDTKTTSEGQMQPVEMQNPATQNPVQQPSTNTPQTLENGTIVIPPGVIDESQIPEELPFGRRR